MAPVLVLEQQMKVQKITRLLYMGVLQLRLPTSLAGSITSMCLNIFVFERL
jgi:hypothetical protein